MIPDELLQFARQLSPMFSSAAAAMAQQERAIAEAAHQTRRLADAIARPETNWRELKRISRRAGRRQRTTSCRESARRADHNRKRAANLVRGADWAPTWWWSPPPRVQWEDLKQVFELTAPAPRLKKGAFSHCCDVERVHA